MPDLSIFRLTLVSRKLGDEQKGGKCFFSLATKYVGIDLHGAGNGSNFFGVQL